MLTPRPYQRESIDATYAHWQSGGGNGLIVIPTGGGKSLVIALLLQELSQNFPLMRICIVTHSKELIVQNYQEFIRLWPQAQAGIYSAGVGRRDVGMPIVFCGIQSVWNKTHLLGRYDLILVDEAHLISRNANTMYGKFFDAMRLQQPNMRVLGLTATPYRMDSGRLDQGEGRLFDKVIYEAGVRDLIENGYLSRLVSKHTTAEINTAGVHRRGGEFIPAELEAASMKGDLVERAAFEIVKRGADRRAWLAFCTGIAHATAVRDALRSHKVVAEQVDGSMGGRDRDGIIRAYREGRIKCLTSVNVLSIGFNVPQVDLIAMLRPTESVGLYIQQAGRGLRLAMDKVNCLILDFAGNVRKHGPLDDVKESRDKSAASGSGEDRLAPSKVCPECESYMHPAVRVCLDCGHEWEIEVKHDAVPDTEVEIISTRSKDGYVPVSDVQYYKHQKQSGSRFATDFAKQETPPTLRVSYGVGVSVVNDWLCFSHAQGSYPQRRASSWWLEAGGKSPVPVSVEEALSRCGELKTPSAIKYQVEDGFKKVVARRYVVRELVAA
jgi:DNA repair protein RadD